MASLTQKTEKRRRKKLVTNGRDAAKRRTRNGTPKFPIHPENTATASK